MRKIDHKLTFKVWYFTLNFVKLYELISPKQVSPANYFFRKLSPYHGTHFCCTKRIHIGIVSLAHYDGTAKTRMQKLQCHSDIARYALGAAHAMLWICKRYVPTTVYVCQKSYLVSCELFTKLFYTPQPFFIIHLSLSVDTWHDPDQ